MPVLCCGAATALAIALRDSVLPENLVLLYLLLVITITIKIGRAAGILASLLSVLLYDVFLVPPYLSLSVHDTQHLVTFGLMLVVSLITSMLVEGMRARHQAVVAQERQTEGLRHMSVELAGAKDLQEVCDVAERHVAAMLNASASILVRTEPGGLARVHGRAHAGADAFGMGSIALTMLSQAGPAPGQVIYSAGLHYIALHAPQGVHGVLVLRLRDVQGPVAPSAERFAAVVAGQLAMAIERVLLAGRAAVAENAIGAERFRNSVLGTVAHDLRTPLTALTGLTSQLVTQPGRSGELEMAIHRMGMRLNGMVSNLLDLARFSHGDVGLRKDWHFIEEVIGTAIAQHKENGPAVPIRAQLRGRLSLVEFDVHLIERVLVNLLENTRRHATGATAVEIRALHRPQCLVVVVEDDGSGAGMQMTDTGELEFPQSTDGGGIGLTICRAIVHAHGGSMKILRRRPHGTRVCLALPRTTIPTEFDANDICTNPAD